MPCHFISEANNHRRTKGTHSANTHRGHGNALVLAAQLGQCSDNLASTGGTQRMAKSTVTG